MNARKILLLISILFPLHFSCADNAGNGLEEQAVALNPSFSRGEGKCTDKEASEVALDQEGKVLSLRGVILVSNPCHTLEQETLKMGSVITLKLTPLDPGEICVQCLGEIPFETTLESLDPGDYLIKVTARELSVDKTLLEESVVIP